MGHPKNFIEMNGKRIDAATGQAVGSTTSSAPHSSAAGHNVDGFVRRKTPKSHSTTKAHAVHKKIQRSQTLMRRGVKRPASKGHSPIEPKLAPMSVVPEPTVQTIDPKREARAHQIKRSRFISRFSSKSQTTDLAPVAPATRPANKVTKPHTTIPAKNPELENTLKKAVASARSHEEPVPKRTKRRQKLADKLHISQRALNAGLVVIAFVAIGGFIAYQNVPNLSMRLAAARSGVNGNLPGYSPSGFSLNGPIFYQPGQITIAYKSNSDERKFNVIERNSSWNNETLLEKHVAASQRSYQTYQHEDKMIFIYDGSNASWLENGVWYEVQGNSSLTQDQLIRIANSL